MNPTFREDKTTQAACLFIQKAGGSSNIMKLIKLMYIADHKRIIKRGRPITFADYFSLDMGPILSKTLDLAKHRTFLGTKLLWIRYVSEKKGGNVEMLQENCLINVLSEAESEDIEQTWTEFGPYDQWELVRWCHDNLGECQDPMGGAIPISYHDILTHGGRTEVEAGQIVGELQSLSQAPKCFAF